MANIKVNLDSLKPQKEIRRHKVKEGVSTFRILPPFGDESNGYPYRKWSLVWMQDPQTGTRRPYVSTMSTEKRCPFYELVKELEGKVNRMKAEGASKDELASVSEMIATFRPKNAFLYNASDRDGNVGILELKATAHDQLKKLMGEYIKDYNQDPTSLSSADDDSGVWFKFERTGKHFDTKYSVEKEQQKVRTNGKLVFEDDRTPLPPHVVDNYDSLAYNIHTLYQIRSYDESKAVLEANIKLFESGNFDRPRPSSGDGEGSASTVERRPTTASRPVSLKLDSEDSPPHSSGGDDLLAEAERILRG